MKVLKGADLVRVRVRVRVRLTATLALALTLTLTLTLTSAWYRVEPVRDDLEDHLEREDEGKAHVENEEHLVRVRVRVRVRGRVRSGVS